MDVLQLEFELDLSYLEKVRELNKQSVLTQRGSKLREVLHRGGNLRSDAERGGEAERALPQRRGDGAPGPLEEEAGAAGGDA